MLDLPYRDNATTLPGLTVEPQALSWCILVVNGDLTYGLLSIALEIRGVESIILELVRPKAKTPSVNKKIIIIVINRTYYNIVIVVIDN